MVSQPEPQETNNRSVEGEDASSEATKSFSKMSVKSKTSNVSVKSKPGSKTSLKDDSKESLKVSSYLAKVTSIYSISWLFLKPRQEYKKLWKLQVLVLEHQTV